MSRSLPSAVERESTLRSGNGLVLLRGTIFSAFMTASAMLAYGDDAALRARLETEAPRRWSEFKSISSQLDIEFIQRNIRSDSERVMRSTVKSSDGNALLIMANLKTGEEQRARLQGTERVVCRNSRNSFKLQKRDADRAWFVEYIGSADDVDKGLQLESALFFPYFVYTHNVMDWFGSSGFSVNNVEWVERPAGKLVAVTFRRDKPEKETYWIHDGVLYLNPERLWAIQECRYDATGRKGEEHVTQQTDFRTDCGSLPLVRTSTITAQTPSGQVQFIFDFNRFEHRDIPEQEFTLTAFGLPEITPPTAWGTNWLWFVLAVVGGGCVAVAIWLRRRASA